MITQLCHGFHGSLRIRARALVLSVVIGEDPWQSFFILGIAAVGSSAFGRHRAGLPRPLPLGVDSSHTRRYGDRDVCVVGEPGSSGTLEHAHSRRAGRRRGRPTLGCISGVRFRRARRRLSLMSIPLWPGGMLAARCRLRLCGRAMVRSIGSTRFWNIERWAWPVGARAAWARVSGRM